MRRTLLLPLLIVSALLLVASAASRVLDLRAEQRSPGRDVLAVVTLLDVNGEANVPAWWGAALLLTAALATAVLAWLSGRRPVLLLAAVLAAMSLDEVSGLHERLEGVGRAVAGGSPLHFTWVVPGAVLAAVVLVVLSRALRGIAPGLRRSLALGAGIYLAGAVVAETLSGLVLVREGDGVEYLLITSAEEGLEMLGAALLVTALVQALDLPRLRAGWSRHPVVDLRAHDEARPRQVADLRT